MPLSVLVGWPVLFPFLSQSLAGQVVLWSLVMMLSQPQHCCLSFPFLVGGMVVGIYRVRYEEVLQCQPSPQLLLTLELE